MPKYSYLLKNGKHLVLEGDTQPDDADVEQAAKDAGVELALADDDQSDHKSVSHAAAHEPSAPAGPAVVALSKAIPPITDAVVSSPTALKVAKEVAKRGTVAAVGAVAGGQVPGIGHVAGAALANQMVTPTAPTSGATNYNTAAGSGNPNRLSPADVAYRQKAGQPMLIDELGNYRAVPTEAELTTAAKKASLAQKFGKLSSVLGALGGAMSGQDLDSAIDRIVLAPNNPALHRKDNGYFGLSFGDPRSAEEQAAHPPLLNALFQAAIDRLFGKKRSDIALPKE